MLKIVLPVALSALSILSPLYAAEVVQGAEGYEFRETFAWAGTHAATLGAGGTTVWWDESAWDVRGDSAYIAVMPIESNITNRFHIDIHKAQSADPRDGRLDNSHTIVGGDGSAGVGVMHLDYQDILDARLRNPLLISPQRPARVRFYASSFNTSGHWWELAITPANRVIGGEYTGVPGQGDAALLEPWPGTTNRSPGPGHSPAEDSVNLVMFGASDVPCITGWQVRAAITRSIGGTTDQFVNTANSMDDLMESDPSLAQTLVHWEVEFRSDGVVLRSDPDEDGTFELVEQWSLSIPWSEVHLHLLGVAYQADHHPQEPCFLGHMRELRWRDVRAWPVKYAATDVFPKNIGAQQVPTQTGWRAYDLRDIQRFGAPVNGVPQPNQTAFSVAHPGAWCNDAGYPCFRSDAQVTLTLPIPSRPGFTIAQARFIHDGRAAPNTNARASVRLNGALIGQLSSPASVPGAEAQAWVRSALSLPAAAIAPNNTFRLDLDTGFHIDRMEVELGYESETAVDHLFEDGFEQGAALAPLHSQRAPAGSTGLPTVRFGKAAGTEVHCGVP
ncbi:MAG: hypothetical protein R3F10_00010 [Lysobacteraceae bacterium]